MSNAPTDTERQRRESITSDASTSGRPAKNKKKPWSKLKSGFKSLGEKMSSKPKYADQTESSEQKRTRKPKRQKTAEEGGEGAKGLMKKLSVESLAAPYVGLQPSTVSPAKSYAKAVHSSTSESTLSASDPDTPARSATTDSGRASQATDAEEAAVGGLVAKTEQFAQSLLPPRAAAEKLKGVSAEFARAEAAASAPPRRGSSVAEVLRAEPKRESTKAAADEVEGRRKKTVDLIKAETGAETVPVTGGEKKTSPVRKQRSEEKLGKAGVDGKSGNGENSKPESKETQQKPRETPVEVDNKVVKDRVTNKPKEKQPLAEQEASKATPKHSEKAVKDTVTNKSEENPPVAEQEASKATPKRSERHVQKDKDQKTEKDDNKTTPKTNDENKQPISDVKTLPESKIVNDVDKKGDKEPDKNVQKVNVLKENKEGDKTPKISEKEVEQQTKDVKKVVEFKEIGKESKTSEKDINSKQKDNASDPADRLMSVGLDSSGASNFVKDSTRDGLTVEEKLETFLSAENWPSTLREDAALVASGDKSQQGGGGGGGERRECLYKILVIGELGTGKTSIIKRYVHQFFSQHYRATIGVDFALKVLNWDPNTIIRLQLWDIAGQERFGNMTRVYYKEAVGAFIVFDVTRSATFDAVLKWKQDLDSKVQLADGGPIPCVLLANKCDQQKEGLVNTPSKMDEYCKENNFSAWFETSAKENIKIDDAAKSLVTQILQNDKMSQNGRDSNRDGSMFPLDSKQNGEGSGGCAC